MFDLEVISRRLLRICLRDLLGHALVALHSQACPNPGIQGDAIPSSGFKDEYADDSKITYECLPGFVRQTGSPVITCSSGTWSSLTLTCEKKSCGSPSNVLNGRWVAEDILFGTTITLKCNTGYTIVGQRSTMQCEAGGWNGRGFVREAVKCPLPQPILKARISLRDDKDHLLYGESIFYTCDNSYTLFGESELRCTENGTYSAQTPECRIVNCPQPEVKFGRRVEGGPPPYGHKSFIVYECDKGYQMKGSAKIICEENFWSSKPPVCQKTFSLFMGTNTAPTISIEPNNVYQLQWGRCWVGYWLIAY